MLTPLLILDIRMAARIAADDLPTPDELRNAWDDAMDAHCAAIEARRFRVLPVVTQPEIARMGRRVAA
jgi:hypothetical protein